MTDIARLGYEIDSSQARTAAKDLDRLAAASQKVETGQRKLSAASRDMLRGADGRFMSAAESAAKYGDEIETLRMRYNPLYAASKQFETQQAELQRALALGAISVNQYDVALGRLQAGMVAGAGSVGAYTGALTTMNNVQGTAANQFAQMNDVFVTAVGGMNPVLIGLQQGMQFVQGFAGQSMPQALGSLKGAFMQLVNPMTLVTVGVIAGGAALVQWGYSALTAGQETRTFREVVDELESSVSAVNEISRAYSADGLQSMLDKYGEINGEILAMIENQKTFAISAAMESARTAAAALRDEFGLTEANLVLMSRPGGGLPQLLDTIGMTREGVSDLRRALDDLAAADTYEAQAAALRRVNELLSRSKIASSELAGAALDAESAMRELANSAPASNWMSAAISGVMSLGDAIRGRITEARALAALSVPGNGLGGGRGADPRSFEDDPYWRDKMFPSPAAMDFSTGGDGGGGGGGSDPYAANLERLVESLRTERQVVDDWYQENLTILQDRRAQELLTESEHKAAMEALEVEHQERLAKIQDAAGSRRLSDTASLFGTLADIASAGGQKSAKAVATFQAIEGTINAYGAAVKALNTPGLTLAGRFAAYGSVLAAGLKGVAAIRAAGGSSGGGGKASGPTSATSGARAEPERVTRVELIGEGWLVDMAESVMEQIYDATGRGRVVISRATA